MKGTNHILKGQKTQTVKMVVCLWFIVLFLFSLNQPGFTGITKQVIIEVKPSIIALPPNQVVKVPIHVARVRSTPLRELNTKYNAVSIEKLFTRESIARARESGILVSKARGNVRAVGSGDRDLSNIVTNKVKKELETKGKEMVQAEDIFLLTFDLEDEDLIKQLLKDYKSLAVVEYIEVKE